MDSLQDIIKKASMVQEKAVLVTIIRIDGSAYRKEGTMMFFTEDGLNLGMISGGCLEDDLAEKAMVLMHSSKTRAQKVSYDMTSEDDLGWGRGAGCNGTVHLLLEKVDTNLQSRLGDIQTHLDAGSTVSLIKEIIPIETTYQKSHSENEMKDVIVHTKIIPNKHEIADTSFFKKKSNRKTQGKEKVYQSYFTQIIQPKPRLIIFGAGSDVRPLATFSKQAGFSVIIWDWRQSMLKKSFFPNAMLIRTTSIKDAIFRMGVTKRDYVVIMTHDFQKDRDIMFHILQMEELYYLGILGPRRRTKRLLQGQKNIKTSKYFRAIPEHIHSPIGMPIGADGPDEIAVSILAELILVKQEKWNEKRSSIESLQSNRNIFSSWK